jgi:hypothetical protein
MVKASRKNMRKSRKGSRKGSRKASRKGSRKNRQNGGALILAPMELTDTSMMGASRMSTGQGIDFLNKHSAQHGGGVLEGAPVGHTGMLDASMRGSARMEPLDAAYAAVVGKSDQAGGKRRKASRKGRKASRKGSRKGRKASRKGRKQNGGMQPLGYMNTDAPGMLLQGQQAHAALSNMSREWALAQNPNSFAPKH